MKSILIKNIVLNNKLSDILIKDNLIDKISENIDFQADRIINGNGRSVIPGLVNMHTHAAMTLMRGIGEDLSLTEWLETKIWPTERKLTDEMVYWGTKLACLEMIKSGTTCFNDQYWSLPYAVKAADEMGMRSFQPYVILDLLDESNSKKIKYECEKMYELSGTWSSRNKFAIGLHAPYSVSRNMIVWASEFAQKRDLLVHIHLSETKGENERSVALHGVSPTFYLEQLGVLNSKMIAAHSLWMDDADIELLAKRDVKIVHNINSNLKIASGYKFRYNEFRDAGLTVSLGTDGCASSNNLDMIETMKTTALVQKGWRGDPRELPLDELISLATVNGGKSLGIKCGVIKEGYLADLVIIDTNSYAFTPNINFLANLIYSANSSCVDTVICDGKILMENRMIEGEQEILRMANKLYINLL
ncbi:MAG: amidohydrolase [Bacteroidales bacterium]|jgi:5-methylthioadenosine/S-adenosylhomocysteine deaminase